MTLQALLDNGDEVLIPAPDYPLWTASTVAGRRHPGALPVRRDQRLDARHRRPGIQDHRPHQGARGDQPEQPDRRGLQPRSPAADRRIWPASTSCCSWPTRSTTRSSTTTPSTSALASLAPDLLCLTFNGLSKAYRVAGYRSGWLVITGPKDHASSFIEGINLLANMRLCPNVPAQHAIQVALGGHQSIDDLVLPGGRLLEQRDVAWSKLNEIPGVSCVKPDGRAVRLPAARPRGATTSTTTSSSSSTCCCRRRSWSPRAPASTGRHPTTCGS